MNTQDRYTLDRKKLVNARVNDLEYERLRGYAMAHGLSLSHVMRERLADIIQPPGFTESIEAGPKGGR